MNGGVNRRSSSQGVSFAPRGQLKYFPGVSNPAQGANLKFKKLSCGLRRRLDAGTFGTMGVGLGFAIAAALYCRDHVSLRFEETFFLIG
jgi:hypothetical protein